MASGYEELRIYQQALQGVRLIYSLTSGELARKDFSLVDQLRRAATSVVANIAEGYGRKSDKDFARFVSISLGSVNEVKAFLDVVAEIYPKIKVSQVKDYYILLGKQIWSFRRTLSSQLITDN